jgi:hypothetical protein
MPPPDGVPDSPDVLIVHGFDPPPAPQPTPAPTTYVDWAQKYPFFASPGQIRIPAGAGGQWYSFSYTTNAAAPYNIYNLNMQTISSPPPGGEYLQLATSFPQSTNPPGSVVADDVTSGYSSCDIQLGNDVLPFHQPISLPSGCVIDLAFCSSNVQTLAGYVPQTPNPATPYLVPAPAPTLPVNNVDVMFSPRGNVTGINSALGAMFFCLRSTQDATLGLNPAYAPSLNSSYPQTPGDCLILAVFPQTGLVQTYDADLRSTVTPGVADNIFYFAQRGMSAGR